TIAQIDANQSVLHDAPALLQGEEDAPRIVRPIVAAIVNDHVHAVAVVVLHGDGHVMLVDEQFVVGRGHLLGGDLLVTAKVIGRGEQAQQLTEAGTVQDGGMVHRPICSKGSASGSGSGGGWRSRTESTR